MAIEQCRRCKGQKVLPCRMCDGEGDVEVLPFSAGALIALAKRSAGFDPGQVYYSREGGFLDVYWSDKASYTKDMPNSPVSLHIAQSGPPEVVGCQIHGLSKLFDAVLADSDPCKAKST